jgi:hypothetical protein
MTKSTVTVTPFGVARRTRRLGPGKPPGRSRTLWLNLAMFVVFLGGLPELHQVVPPRALPFVGLVCAAAGFYLRLRTHQPLRGTRHAGNRSS